MQHPQTGEVLAFHATNWLEAWYTLLVAAKTHGTFEKYIGIDWSGASGPYLKKLQVAACDPGESLPKIVLPPRGKYWRRDDLIDWIIREAKHRRILVGADFAFAYPYCDESAYFPKHPASPESPQALWKKIDSICKGEPSFYAGPFYKDRGTPFSEYLCYQTYRGAHFDSNRLRRTEQACELVGTRPTSVFKCVGPDQVGSGSASGMRVLHFLAANHSRTISIWPFDSVSESKSTLVEIFPRLFFALAGKNSRQWRVDDIVNAVLRYFGSEPLTQGATTISEDEADAIVSAVALRTLSSRMDVWYPQSLDEEIRRFEGWILGCG